MIGKISMGSGAAGVINYCYYEKNNTTGCEKVVRGELLFSNELWKAQQPNGHLHIQSLGAQYHQLAALHETTKKFIWHQTFNFPPGEKISNEIMVKIAQDFAKDFGFENNQYLVFRHRDKPHEHFHIIANRINADGQITATDKQNYKRIQQFCRQMEKKYGLSITENPQQKTDKEYRRKNTQVDRLKLIIETEIPYCETLSELSIALRKKDIKVYLERGISFTDQKYGVTFKGSDLGREYSRNFLEKRLKDNNVTQLYREKHEYKKYQPQDKFPPFAIPYEQGVKKKSSIEFENQHYNSSKLIQGNNNANETNKDLAKIAQSLQSVSSKKIKRKLK